MSSIYNCPACKDVKLIWLSDDGTTTGICRALECPDCSLYVEVYIEVDDE